MTNPNLTLIAFLIDRSGSMGLIHDDTEGGLKSFIKSQKEDLKDNEQIECWLSDFDHEYVSRYRRVPIQEVQDYKLSPRGTTALIDALYRLIKEVGEDLSNRSEESRPGKVMIVTMTDGHENSSTEVTVEQLRALIKQQEVEYDWDFTFLGANIDAVKVGANFGFAADKSLTYSASEAGVNATFANMTRYASAVRSRDMDSAVFTDEERSKALGE